MSLGRRMVVAVCIAVAVVAVASVGAWGWREAGIHVAADPLGRDGSPVTAKERRQRTHRLEPGEVARLVPPPVATPLLPAMSSGPPGTDLYRVFYGNAATGWQEDRKRCVGSAASVLESVLGGENVQVRCQMAEFNVSGDWVVDGAAPVEARAAAAMEILHKATARYFRADCLVTHRPCIVAEGMLRRRTNKLDDPRVDTVATPDVMLAKIATASGHRLINRMLGSDIYIALELRGRLERTSHDLRELDQLLDDISRQTSLKVRRDVVREVTFIVQEQAK